MPTTYPPSSSVAGAPGPLTDLDASANPNYPAADAGDRYRITVAGKVGGASGKVVEAGDVVEAIAANAGGTEASVGTSWIVMQANIASITAAGLAMLQAANAAAQQVLLGITGGGVIALGGFTLTVPATGTAALLGTANVFTAAQTISVAGANSAPPLYLTGALNVAGTGTTTFPHIFHQPIGTTAATTWSSGANGGTVFGANEPTGFVGNFADFRLAGVIRAVISYDGRIKGIYNPSYPQFTAAGLETSGMRVYSDRVDFWQAGIIPLTLQGDAINLGTGTSINWNSGATLRSKAAATLQLGVDAAGVTNQMFTAASRITSDGPGADLQFAGGNGRGGAGGSLIFSTYSTAGAATIGTLTTRLTLDTNGLLTFADAVNMAFHTTTGTKIGTASNQKLGFWGTTPVTQPARIVGLLDNSGGMIGGNTIGLINGAADPTAAALTDTQNAISTLASKINEIEALLTASLGGVGLTA